MKNVKEMRIKCRELPAETQSALFRQLMCAVLSEAVEDYVGTTPQAIKKVMPKYLFKKSVIMQDLNNPKMIALSDGLSLTVAMQLKNNLKQVESNLASMDGECNIIKVETYDTPQYR